MPQLLHSQNKDNILRKLWGLSEEMHIKHLKELTWEAFNIIIATKHFYSCYKWILLKTHCPPDTWSTVWKERTHSHSSKGFEETERMSAMGAVLRPVITDLFSSSMGFLPQGHSISPEPRDIKGEPTIHPEEPKAWVQQGGDRWLMTKQKNLKSAMGAVEQVPIRQVWVWRTGELNSMQPPYTWEEAPQAMGTQVGEDTEQRDSWCSWSTWAQGQGRRCPGRSLLSGAFG